MMNKYLLCIFLIFASTYSLASEETLSPSTIQSLSALQQKVEQHVIDGLASSNPGSLKVVAGRLDPRIQLKVCADDKLEVFNPYDTPLMSASSMGVRCIDEKNPWTLFLPIKITAFKSVLLTKQALRKGDSLNKAVLYQAEMDVQKLKQGYFTNPKELDGLVSSKDIAPNTPITPYNIARAKLVLRGQEVTIVASVGNLKISMPGVALLDGAMGDVIKVKNTKSNNIVEGQVSGKNEIKVAM